MTGHDPFAALGVAPVINAAGKMTALGGSVQTEPVAAAQAAAARAHVDVAALRDAAGRRIAERCGAEAACVTTGAAAGICISVAAVLTGCDAERVQRVPDGLDGPRQVVLQAGHDIFFGTTVLQMIRLAGGIPVVAGDREQVTEEDVRACIGADTACLMYVRSHHCIQERRVDFDTYRRVANEANLPLLVDAAAEEDLAGYIAAGADLVTYSGGKAIGGPTSGFIAGRRGLVAACELQGIGIARPMKVGKEQIVGLMAALESYSGRDGRRRVLDALHAALEPLPHLVTSIVPDRAGRAIDRLGVRAAGGAFDMPDLVRWLESGSPSIRTRNHQLGEGLLLFDPRELALEHVEAIRARVAAFLQTVGR